MTCIHEFYLLHMPFERSAFQYAKKNADRKKIHSGLQHPFQLIGIDAPVPPATIPSDCTGLSAFSDCSAIEDEGAEVV